MSKRGGKRVQAARNAANSIERKLLRFTPKDKNGDPILNPHTSKPIVVFYHAVFVTMTSPTGTVTKLKFTKMGHTIKVKNDFKRVVREAEPQWTLKTEKVVAIMDGRSKNVRASNDPNARKTGSMFDIKPPGGGRGAREYSTRFETALNPIAAPAVSLDDKKLKRDAEGVPMHTTAKGGEWAAHKIVVEEQKFTDAKLAEWLSIRRMVLPPMPQD